jgi:hypothetical protein
MKLPRVSTKMYVILGICLIVVIAIAMIPRKPTIPPGASHEAFEVSACPERAHRNAEGEIVVQPGDRRFKTMADYVDFLKPLVSKEGTPCIPPMVEPHRGPEPGLIGGQGNGAPGANAIARETADRAVAPFEQPSAQTPINSLDDYEYSRVFGLEEKPRNSQESKKAKDAGIADHILDWANLPFNSEEKAKKEKEFVAGRRSDMTRDPKSGVFFKTLEGDHLMPPDEEALKQRERAILAAYKPTDASKHVIDNESERVAKMVHEMYANDPNWEPVLEKTGENRWEVRELVPKPRKEEWEEEDSLTVEDALQQGVNPDIQMTITGGGSNDPFFDKAGVVDRDNKRFWKYDDFRKFTPGLERMFAPTNDTTNWY